MTLFAGSAGKGFPYWWEEIEWPDLDRALPDRADLLVIGAGYTGLSAAIAGHDAGARVVVIDAGQPGQGASTRNGGMVGAHPRLGWDALARAFGTDTADLVFAEAGTALHWVRALIDEEKIDCDLQETGRIQLAYTPPHFLAQRQLADKVTAKSGVRCEVVPRDELAADIATGLYHGGLRFPDHAALHPAKYHCGLLAAVRRRGIPVVSHAAAARIEHDGAVKRVLTPKGPIRADKVVLGTNGYTDKTFRWLSARVFPLPSFLIATEPLSPDLIGQLAPGRRMMVETRARHSYFRVAPDGSRILFGGRAAMVNIDLSEAARRLHGTMCEIWPDLRGTRITHVWTGNTGYSFTHTPCVGQHDGVHYAVGFSGSGTVLAPYLGAKAALRALGAPDGDTAYAHTTLRTTWYHRGGVPHFLRAADFWYANWIDGRERSAARR